MAMERNMPENRRREYKNAMAYADMCRAALHHAKQVSAVFIGSTPRRADRADDVVMVMQRQLVLMLTAELGEAERYAATVGAKIAA